jgi:hypothetical protein
LIESVQVVEKKNGLETSGDSDAVDPERAAVPEDVQAEVARVRQLLAGPAESHDAVMIQEIHKVCTIQPVRNTFSANSLVSL